MNRMQAALEKTRRAYKRTMELEIKGDGETKRERPPPGLVFTSSLASMAIGVYSSAGSRWQHQDQQLQELQDGRARPMAATDWLAQPWVWFVAGIASAAFFFLVWYNFRCKPDPVVPAADIRQV